jgi:hypothetical protein
MICILCVFDGPLDPVVPQELAGYGLTACPWPSIIEERELTVQGITSDNFFAISFTSWRSSSPMSIPTFRSRIVNSFLNSSILNPLSPWNDHSSRIWMEAGKHSLQ